MFALVSCMSVNFIRTGGEDRPPLPPGTEVKVLDAKAQAGSYAEIGLLIIKGGSDAKRLGRAKEEALKRGGNGLMPREPKTETAPSSSRAGGAEVGGQFANYQATQGAGKTTVIQEFLVVRLLEGRKTEPAGLSGGEPADYSLLPRAGYRELLDNNEALKEKKFQGALVPVNFYRVPGALGKYDDGTSHLLMVTTRSGRSSLLLFVPKSMEGDIRGMIAKRQLLGFVYSPLDVYTTKEGKKYPVLRMIDRIDER